jgi:hypothetical protein
MYSTTSNRPYFDPAEEPLDDAEYICMAADLLQQMFSELILLAASDTGLAGAMNRRGAYARDRLARLHETVRLLTGIDDP